MSKHSFLFLLIVLGSVASRAALAQVVEGESLEDPATEAQAFDIASRTMSPFCPGRTLADCPSGKATEWRQDIRALLEQGKSAAEIQKILNARAGENLTGTPESSLGWALPVGLCVGALAILTLVLRRVRRDEADDVAEDDAKKTRAPEPAEADEEADEDDADERDSEPPSPERQDKELEERLRRELADQDDV